MSGPAKSEKGLILSFIGTLPMQDARSVMRFWNKRGYLPTWTHRQYTDFLAARQP